MRVLMTTDTVGGVWTYAVELAWALRQRGVECILATMGAPLSDDQRQQLEERDLAYRESDYKLEWMQEPWHDVDAAGKWLLGLEEELEPDLVHLNGYTHAALPWHAPVMVVAHSCVWTWFRAVKHHDPPGPEWIRYFDKVQAGLYAADLVVAPTAALLRGIQNAYGVLPNTSVIPNGRDGNGCLTAPKTKESLVLAAGRLWDEAKNAAAVEQAASDVDWPIYLAGPEASPDDDNGQRSRHLGHLTPDALAQWMRRAAIFAAPARYEPFGLCALEAARCGCALVLGDIPTLREVWGRAASYVDPDSPADLANALDRLIQDSGHRQAMAAAAHRRAQRYTLDAAADAYEQHYRELLQTALPITRHSARPVAALDLFRTTGT